MAKFDKNIKNEFLEADEFYDDEFYDDDDYEEYDEDDGGENGLFGTEELQEIKPAIEAARAAGINAIGPIPPDSVFSEALGGWYDIVVCMYHDQGHIPLKTVGFVYDREAQAWKAVEGVNVTLGLPIIRTSVDHGTGFALAGKGTSNELSLVNAIDYAVRMAKGTCAP